MNEGNCRECAKIFCIHRGEREYCTEIIRFTDLAIKEIDKKLKEDK